MATHGAFVLESQIGLFHPTRTVADAIDLLDASTVTRGARLWRPARDQAMWLADGSDLMIESLSQRRVALRALEPVGTPRAAGGRFDDAIALFESEGWTEDEMIGPTAIMKGWRAPRAASQMAGGSWWLARRLEHGGDGPLPASAFVVPSEDLAWVSDALARRNEALFARAADEGLDDDDDGLGEYEHVIIDPRREPAPTPLSWWSRWFRRSR